jgi:hypothetical protein
MGNPLSGDTIWEASSPSELSTAITTKQFSLVGDPRDLLLAKCKSHRDVLTPGERRGLMLIELEPDERNVAEALASPARARTQMRSCER